MRATRRNSNLISGTLMFLLWVGPASAADPAAGFIKADTVVIADGKDQQTIMGAIEYPLGVGGGIGTPRPAGPIIVFLARRILPSQLEEFRKMGVEAGHAYLMNKQNYRDLKYLMDIDVTLDNAPLAAKFGVLGAPTP